jgi:hypothetical protein
LVREGGGKSAFGLTAAVNDGKQFDNGRQMAASLGLTPLTRIAWAVLAPERTYAPD